MEKSKFFTMLLSSNLSILEWNEAFRCLFNEDGVIIRKGDNISLFDKKYGTGLSRTLDNLNEMRCFSSKIERDGINIDIYWRAFSLENTGNIFLIGSENYFTHKVDSSDGDKKYFNQLIDNVPDFLFWKDMDSVFLGCNKNFAISAGFSNAKEIVGKTDYDLPWREQAKLYIEDDKQVMESGKPKLNIEEVQKILGDDEIILLTSKVPLFNSFGEVCGIIGIYTDITNLKDAQRKAEAASRAKSAFIANMSHDIRTPIAGIIGMVQDLINTAENTKIYLKSNQEPLPEQNTLLSMLQKIISLVQRDGDFLIGATDELLQLCNEILETVSLESGKMSEKPESFDIRELIKHNIDLLQPVAHNNQLSLSAEIDSQVPLYLKGLRAYLDRTLLNLTSNALKFTDTGFVKIRASLQNASDTTVQQEGCSIVLIISVEDSGIGIPHDKFDSIFEHFSRLMPSFEGIYKGSGLGLYTVKQYVKAMKGKIKVESKLGEGSKFIIQIPFTVSDHSDYKRGSIRPIKSVKQPKKPAPTIDFTEFSEPSKDKDKVAGRVLVVEDNNAAAMAVKISLLGFNCSVDIAQNGKEGVNKAKQGNYDLILMDIGLPDISGLVVSQEIRKLPVPQAAQTPIVALTGHLNKRDDCLAAGMQDLLSKPVQPLALESVLQRYVFDPNKYNKSTQDIDTTATGDNKENLCLIDWTACLHMCGDDEEMAKQLLFLCVEELKITKTVLQKAYEEKDTKALRTELHRCLGGVCYLRLPQLESALKTFQTAVKSEPQDPNQLENFYQELKKTIEDFFDIYQKGDFMK